MCPLTSSLPLARAGYLADAWNLIDCFTILSVAACTYLAFFGQSYELTKLLPFGDTPRTEGPMHVLSMLTTGLLWIKTLSYVKVLNQKFAT